MKKLIPLFAVALVAFAALMLVSCEELTGDKPTNVQVAAATDSTVKITWSAPADGNPDKYLVKFQETGTSTYTQVGDVTTTEFTHDPAGKTGKYVVVAKFGGNEYEADAVTTTPIATAEKSVGELNAAELAGYGWSRSDGKGATYTMKQAGSAANVDFYITDWVQNWPGPYSIASPDLAPSDTVGGRVAPAGSWRINGFSNALSNVQAPLPRYVQEVTYFNYTDLTTDPIWIGCYARADGYYALAKLSGFNTTNGTVKAESWFQMVKGLRLIQH